MHVFLEINNFVKEYISTKTSENYTYSPCAISAVASRVLSKMPEMPKDECKIPLLKENLRIKIYDGKTN